MIASGAAPASVAAATVLLVESDAAEAELTLRLLRPGAALARDGEEALRFLAHSIPRLILLARRLPKLDGLELLARIRIDARLRIVPVVLLTSEPNEADLARAYALGVNSVIRKPVLFEELAAALSQVETYWMERNEVLR